MNRRKFIASSAATAGLIAMPVVLNAADATTAPSSRAFDVRDFGALLDGKADDSPAIQRAFDAMKIDSKAFGTLVISGGVARLAKTLDFDGGYRNTSSEEQWAAGKGEDLRILMVGALRPDPGIGTAVFLHGARNVFVDLHFDRGGKEEDIALKCEDLDFADIGVRGNDFAGTLLYADASSDKSKRIRTSKIRHVFASQCGRAIYWRGIEAFGSFEMVWDRNCKNGSHFLECADVGIQHYENFSPATQKIGLHFEECNNFNVGIITVGDRAAEAMVQITGGDFGSINRLRASGRPDTESATKLAALRLLNVKSLNIDNLHTFRAQIGLHAIGSNVNVKRHHSMTGDVVPLVIEGTETYPKPRIEIGATYRYNDRESVRIEKSVTGGTLKLHGTLYEMNIHGPRDLFAIDCASEGMILDVAALTIEPRDFLAGSIRHPVPANIRGVSRARLANTLVHGQISIEGIAPGQVAQNGDERTLHLTLNINARPAPNMPATCEVHMGPTKDALTLLAVLNRDAGQAPTIDPVTVRIPPWWWYRIDLEQAKIHSNSRMWE